VGALGDLEQAAVRERPPSLEIDLAKMFDVVFGAAWTIFAPASWCWPLPAKAIESTSPCARSPMR
jgi:hypothetical protein